eukprot:gene1635-33026_t
MVAKEQKEKKEKKDKKKREELEAADVEPTAAPAKKKSKKSKKDENGVADAESEPAAPPAKKSKKAEKKAGPTETDDAPAPDFNELSLDNFPLSAGVKSILRSQGIEALFAIQALTVPLGLDGFDVVGRARTGCGKTLGFALPIVERILLQQKEAATSKAPALYQTRSTKHPSTIEGILRRGADVVVGTPGRIKDLITRGSLKLDCIRYRVLDEVDRMMAMGFIEDVETILKTEEEQTAKIQTFLFSATMPKWVKSLCERFLRPDYKMADLVDDSMQKAATTVRHLLLPCHHTQRAGLMKDLITSYGLGGRTIIFTDTKADAASLAMGLQDSLGAQPIHGDLAQSMRETTLEGFKNNKFPVLVATDVAARGLDISGVDPPSDWETYIHRSGRTGRAGHTGTCVTLVTARMEYMVAIIEKKGGFKYERIGAPQPSDMAKIAAERAVNMLKDIDDSVLPYFREAAEKFLEESNSPVEALSLALAKITGKSGKLAHDVVESAKRMSLTADSKGAVFDVPTVYAKAFLESAADRKGAVFDVPTVYAKAFLESAADSKGAVFDVSTVYAKASLASAGMLVVVA